MELKAVVLNLGDVIDAGVGATVWVEKKGETFCHRLKFGGGADGGTEGTEFFHNPENGELYVFTPCDDEYGITWRCWTDDPTTIERVKIFPW